MAELSNLKLHKAWYGLTRPACWRALSRGVAPSIEHRAVLASLAPDLVLDIGANRGQFTLMTRMVHPSVRIHAYEPLPDEATVFRAVHRVCPHVELHELALGDQNGTAEVHVSGRADSSSLLPIGELQAKLFPHTREVGTHSVKVVTLDSLPTHWQEARRGLLKLDVQGFELSALRGAKRALEHCAYVYAECSEVPLYEGQALRCEVDAFLREQGFVEHSRSNEFVRNGQLIQADYLFRRA